MQADSPTLIAFLLLMAAASGWVAANWFRRRERSEAGKSLSPDYLKGLNFLLEEQPDKALESFIRMAVDDDTVETHFALGNLFRKRGEVDRAIRIHQNIIARPNLARTQRDQALFALADDYLSAGMLDRAEKLFEQLADTPAHRASALEKLVRIYEQQQDWRQAIAIRQALKQARPGSGDSVVSHYYCELAQEAIDERDFPEARQYLKKAHTGARRKMVRSALMRARVALQSDDLKTATKLYRQVAEQEPSFVAELFVDAVEALRQDGGEQAVTRFVDGLIKKNPAVKMDIAYAAVRHNEIGNPSVRECVREYIRTQTLLARILDELGLTGDDGPANDEKLASIASALRTILDARPAYLCSQCGYASGQLYWQCPSCKTWDSSRPNTMLKDPTHGDPSTA